MHRLAKLAKTMIDHISLAALRAGPADRVVRFLSYQRKRLIRRDVERRLHQGGIYGDTVVRGPLEGLRYPPRDCWVSCRFEKIIGAYEFEIHPFVSRLFSHRDYHTIIDIGAAEGFFAVGFARRFPDALVVAFERDAEKAETMKKLAALNQVSDQLTILGNCAAADLQRLRDRSPELVFCDTEGAEKDLLDPEAIPWLKHSDILVETHDCFEPGITEDLRRRFEASHIIESVSSSGLRYENYPELQSLSFEEIYAMICEERPGLQKWLLMIPRSRPIDGQTN